VAEKVLLEGVPIRKTIEDWPDRMDFMHRIKVPRSSYLAIEHEGVGLEQIQNTARYYVAQGGHKLWKFMPPLKSKPGSEWRKFAVESGWKVCVCNKIEDAVLPVDFSYYVAEVEKLCLALA
jgi:hypothetical protein